MQAPLTEELVFRACMVPLLLCAGFRSYSAIFLCPILFSLGLFSLWMTSLQLELDFLVYDMFCAAHLNHFREMYIRHNRSYIKASLIVGMWNCDHKSYNNLCLRRKTNHPCGLTCFFDQVFSLATLSFLVHLHHFSSSEPVHSTHCICSYI